MIQALGESGNLLILPPLPHLETELSETELHLLCSNSTRLFTQERTPSPLQTPPPPITLIHNPIVTPSVTSGHAHIRCTHVREALTCSEDTRRPGKPSAGLGQRIAVCGSDDDSHCVFLPTVHWSPVSGRAPVPRPGCLADHWGLWGSGKPRGALGRLRPRRTSSTTPEGGGGIRVSVSQRGVMSYQSANKTCDKCGGCGSA